jgi:hypothetical protein
MLLNLANTRSLRELRAADVCTKAQPLKHESSTVDVTSAFETLQIMPVERFNYAHLPATSVSYEAPFDFSDACERFGCSVALTFCKPSSCAD